MRNQLRWKNNALHIEDYVNIICSLTFDTRNRNDIKERAKFRKHYE